MKKNEDGSAAVELTLLTPVLLMLLLLVVAGGRMTNARSDVDAAARDGARAASLARNADDAEKDANDAMNAALAGRQVTCESPTYTVDVGSFSPGEPVSTTVRCEVSLADLTLLPLPSSRTITSTFSEVVDQRRAIS